MESTASYQTQLSPGTTAAGVNAAVSGKASSQEEDKKLRKACAGFESFMVYYMLKTMRKSLPQNGLFGNTPGKDTYYMMLDQQIAEKVAARKGGSLGLQKALYDQLSAGRSKKYGKTGSADGPKAAAVNAKI